MIFVQREKSTHTHSAWELFDTKSVKILANAVGWNWNCVENYPLETELHVDDSFSFAFDMSKSFTIASRKSYTSTSIKLHA